MAGFNVTQKGYNKKDGRTSVTGTEGRGGWTTGTGGRKDAVNMGNQI